MCHLISVLQPRDVYPCVADEKIWASGCTVRQLFGPLCSGNCFVYDEAMLPNQDENILLPPSYRWPVNSSVQEKTYQFARVNMTPGTGLDPVAGLSAPLRPQSRRARHSAVIQRLTTPSKRQATLRARPRKRTPKNTTRRALEDDRVLRSSFSGWVKASNDEPVEPRCAGAQLLQSPALDVPVEAGTSDAVTAAGGGRGEKPPFSSTDHSRTESASDGTTHRDSKNNTDSATTFMTAGSTYSTKPKPPSADDGTQLRPFELSDTSGSETEDNSGKLIPDTVRSQ